MTFVPRYYQTEALDSVEPLSPGCRKLVVIPTGGGKSYIAGRLATDSTLILGRVLILAHVKELIVQNALAVLQADPRADIGIVCAGIDPMTLPAHLREFLGRTDAEITIASIQSVYRKLHLWSDVGLILVDEAHRITPIGGKLYRAVMDEFPITPIVGLTATPFRMGTGYLHKGDHALFEEISYEITMEELIELGFLVPFAKKGSELAYSDEGLKKVGDDFSQKDLARLTEDGAKTRNIVKQFIQRAGERNHWLIFAMNVKHARMIKDLLDEEGVSAGIIHDKMHGDGLNRDDEIDLFKLGIYRALINVNVLTTGFDFPALDCIGLIRPLASVVLYIQCLGRGTRLSPATNKIDCLILDYGGNAGRFGDYSNPDVKAAKAGKRTKQCDACGEFNTQAARACVACNVKFPDMFKPCPKCNRELDRSSQKCDGCGYAYPLNESRLDEDGKTIINNTAIWVDLDRWKIKSHSPYCPPGQDPKPNCVKIEYKGIDGVSFPDYIFPESFGARPKFERFWTDHQGKLPVPATSEKAKERGSELRMPRRVKVIKSGSYYNILAREF